MPESAQSSLQRIGQAQRSDPDVRCVITWMGESSTKPEWGEVSSYSTAIKSFWGQWESLKLHEGKLYRTVDNDPAQQLWQLVVPKALRKTVLEQLHDSPVGGHFGVAKTLAKVRNSFGQSADSSSRNGAESVISALPAKGQLNDRKNR